MFVWYLESPAHWIRATIISDMLGIISAETYDGRRLDGLRKRRVADAVILEKKGENYER